VKTHRVVCFKNRKVAFSPILMYLHSSSAYGVQPVTIILGRKFKGVTESLGSKREFNSSTDSVESRWYGVKSENMAPSVSLNHGRVSFVATCLAACECG